ncbi:MAG TPA: 1-(5-phosphoribosyl)-5-[(5-phosphoribosylamino)methylideneamino]imidazole-4-carboxamide isomerase [Fodinibius sp.]|nr:1-(5-phosphoribosyl)-5-[(5-phosphoribosylamino)methylideneamino]imidazole-4-carboxamide isomerase [Fodinibius sp.]
MHIIPAIDLLDGQVVRLHKGKYEEATIYNDDPLQEARRFSKAGFNHIHIVDLNGAKEGNFVNLEHIRHIISELEMSAQTGGGIRSYDDAAMLIDHGVSNIICSSMAVKSPDEWGRVLDDYAKQAILGMDLKGGKVAYSGWLKTLDQSLDDFLQPMIERGLSTILCTDISRDGTLEGTNLELYKNLQQQYPELDFIASGGVASVDDFKQLSKAELYGVVVGRAYYEQKISLKEMQHYHSA